MGRILNDVGRVAVEIRRESFIVHAAYDERPKEDALATAWREGEHPEFMVEDLDDLIAALIAARDHLVVEGRRR